MAQKVGGRSKKGRQSAKNKSYYEKFRQQYSGKLIRRRAKREKRLQAVKEHPEIGSPSQLRLRKKRGLYANINHSDD